MTWDVLMQQWWVQVTSAIAAGLALMAVAAIFSATVRNKFWKPIGHAIRWPFVTIRFTTAKRQRALAADLEEAQKSLARNAEFYDQLGDALGIVLLSGDKQLIDRVRQLRDDAEKNARRFKEVCDLLEVWPVREDSTIVVERITRLQEAKDEAWAHAKEQIEATQSLAKKQLADQARRGGELAETAKELGRTEGHATAMAEVEAQRAVPQLRPTWRVVEVADGHFDLRNSQSGFNPKDIQNVSIEAPMLDFAFDGSNQWPGYFPGMVGFEGHRIGKLSIRFVVRWQDRLGDHKAGEAVLEGKPRRAVVL